ncbi:MAG: sulfite exporter TauE/SafE family protein [Clostridia bacterium]
MEKYRILTAKDEIKINSLLIVGGLITGFANGFFGGGGGMLVVPLLTIILKLSEKQSHATAIAIILPLSIISAAAYLAKGITGGEWLTSVTVGVVIGGAIGAVLLSKLSTKLVSGIFYVVMIAAGIRMLM